VKAYCSTLIFANQKQIMSFDLTDQLIAKAVPITEMLSVPSTEVKAFKDRMTEECKDLSTCDIVSLAGLHMYLMHLHLERRDFRKNVNHKDKVMILPMIWRDNGIVWSADKDCKNIMSRDLITEDYLKSYLSSHNIDTTKSRYVTREYIDTEVPEVAPEVVVPQVANVVLTKVAKSVCKDTYSFAGIATNRKGVISVKYTNDAKRLTRLVRDGFTDVKFVQLPHAMLKPEVNQYLIANAVL
jgi:hypothetical protein